MQNMYTLHISWISLFDSSYLVLLGTVSPLEPAAYKSDIQLHITWFWWEYQSALGVALIFLTECNRVSAVIRPEGQWTRRNVSPDNMLWPSSAVSRFGVNSRWRPECKDETHNLRLYWLWQGLCWCYSCKFWMFYWGLDSFPVSVLCGPWFMGGNSLENIWSFGVQNLIWCHKLFTHPSIHPSRGWHTETNKHSHLQFRASSSSDLHVLTQEEEEDTNSTRNKSCVVTGAM